jgi:hypothetical protein
MKSEYKLKQGRTTELRKFGLMRKDWTQELGGE